MDYSPPDSSVHGIPQAIILEWIAISPGDPGDPVDLPNRGINPVSPELTGGFFTTEPPGLLLWSVK